MRVYIINGRATRKKLDDRSHRGYFMGYAATTRVILYWKPDKPFVIHRANHVWFDEYNSRLYIEDNQTPGSLLLWQYPESNINNLDLLKFIPCEPDLTSTPFSDTKLSHMQLSYLPLERKLVLIYCIMKLLKSHISLI